jgi:hypothetical protein
VIIAVYVPFLRPFFGTVSLSLGDWLMMLPYMLAASVAAEGTKVFLRRRSTYFRQTSVSS